MLSIGTVSSGHGFYYTGLTQEQYYTQGGEPPGRWYGEAAEHLALTGEVTKEQLQQVLKGFAPDGSKLVQNAGKDNRQAGLDLTLSADKSVSVLWAVGDKATQKAIQQAHSNAVDFALGYLEREAAWTRRGHGGTDFEKCKLIFARFDHATSRAGDPNLHTHVLVPNVGLREDGKTAALWNKEQYLHKMTVGALYRAALAHELGPRGLGYEIEPDKRRGLFRLACVPEKVTEHFSKRHAQIEAELQEHGISKTAKAADRANQATRQVKGHVARAELFPQWKTEASALGFKKAPAPQRAADPTPSWPLFEKAQASAEKLAEHKATFRAQDLVRQTAHQALDGLTTPADILRDADRALEQEQVLTVHEGKRHPLLTTQGNLRREHGILSLAQALGEKRGLTVDARTAQRVKDNSSRALDTEERTAAFDYLTTATGNLKLLTGVAGTGKTSLLEAARHAWEAQGYRVIGTAVAGKAARELQVGAGIQTETIRKRQMQLDPTLVEQLKHHAKELKRAAKYGTHKPSFDSKVQAGLEGLLKEGKWGKAPGYRPLNFDRLKLDAKTVLVIDESSMLGLKDTTQMLRLAKDAGAKVVMVGDERQLPAIEAVSPFEALGAKVGRFELQEIKRQEKPWMRSAVQAFANGDTRTGLSLLKDHGSLHMSKGGPSATKQQLVDDWAQSPGKVSDKLILTATNADAKSLNALAQQARLNAGELGKRLTVKLGSGEAARRGDRILFGQNNKKLDVRNGELGTIERIHKPIDANFFNKGEVTIKTDHGEKVRLNLNKYTNTSLGYALTTHKAQGSTVDRAFTYTTAESAARDMLYVQTSRAREEMRVYAPGHDLGEDLQDFQHALTRETGVRELALQQAERLAHEKAAELEQQRKLEEEKQRGHSRSLGIRRSRKVGE